MRDRTIKLRKNSPFFVVISITAILALLLFSTQATAQDGASREKPHLTETKARYGFENWPAGVDRDGLPLAELNFSGYRWEPVEFTPGMPLLQHLSDESGKVRMLIEIQACATSAEAKERLAGYLSRVSSAGNKPTTASAGMEAGDVGYVGYAPGNRIAWVAFARGSVCIRLCHLDPRVDSQFHMRFLAERIDKLIRSQPALTKDRSLSRPQVTGFTASATTCKAGAVLPLDLKVKDPAGKPAALRWIVGGPGQGYVEQGKDGIWRLHTTKAGAIRLTCQVLGPRGFTTEKSLAVEVTPDR